MRLCPQGDDHDPLVRTARITGAFYLALAITGGLSFLLIRGQLYVPDQADETLANLVDSEMLARLGIAMEMGVVLTQALAAVWFYRCSVRSTRSPPDAWPPSGWSTPWRSSAARRSWAPHSPSPSTPPRHQPGRSRNRPAMYLISGHLWDVGGLFFGLWLVPMGWLVLRSGWMPRPLGWILVTGGVGYVCSAFFGQLVPDADAVSGALTLPATVGEVWMVGYLLVRGVGTPVRGGGGSTP